MIKARVILSLLLMGFFFVYTESHDSKNINMENRQDQQNLFRSGYEYVFEYSGQIALGLVNPTTEKFVSIDSETDMRIDQKASIRIQSQARIVFNSERHATLHLENVRIGQSNTHIQNVQRVQPMGMFERKQIDESKQRELNLPCDLGYENGVITRIQFHPEDKIWSKNIKRAVLNLIQINLKPVNEQNNRNIMNDDEKLYIAKAYKVPEV